MLKTAVVWFRRDMRLEDNPALSRAMGQGYAVLPLYIHSPEEEGRWPRGAASNWWLHHALRDLDEQIRVLGGELIVRSGPVPEVMADVLRQTGAKGVFWNRCYEPGIIARDAELKATLRAEGYEVESDNAALLREPHTVANQSGNPFKVFTPFFKHCLTLKEPQPVYADMNALRFVKGAKGEALESLGLLPKLPWDGGFYSFWEPTRAGALSRLAAFIKDSAGDYTEERNRPDRDGTSRLSPYLHFGQIGPREVVWALRESVAASGQGAQTFLSEIYWREFAYHILYHFPATPENPLRPEFAHFPWEHNDELLRQWQTGQTGYPIVDAGMRQLWQTGWMHNRVRMIVASFLVKHLLIPWKAGAEWFWDTLVDADLASNTLGWQWTAGCGADAAPYFRVFNPVLQGEKFDPEGTYVRTYVPELARVPKAVIHKPWTAQRELLECAGVRLGGNYPTPVVEHSAARARALRAFAALQTARQSV